MPTHPFEMFENWSKLPLTVNDWLMIILAILCTILICIFIIQTKRLGPPDERSSTIRSQMLAATFISLLIAMPVCQLFASGSNGVLVAVALSLTIGLIFPKISSKRSFL